MKLEVERRTALGEPATSVFLIEEVWTRNLDGEEIFSHLRIVALQKDDRVEVVLP